MPEENKPIPILALIGCLLIIPVLIIIVPIFISMLPGLILLGAAALGLWLLGIASKDGN